MTGSRRPRRGRENTQRLFIFWYELAWLGLIAWTGWLVATGQPIVGYNVPPTLQIVPTAVPWYGALGGVMISLVGVHEHRYDWDQRYWTWYVARPAVGAFVAIVAVLIFQSGILAVGLDPSKDTASSTVPRDLFYYVLAFITGYREDSFRQLIKRVADVLLTSKEHANPPLITEVDPPSAPAGASVAIRGSGFTGAQVVRFDGVEADFKFASDAQIDAFVPVLDAAGLVGITVATQDTSITQPDMFTFETGELPPPPPSD
jgi:hypothetical protein